MMSTMFDNHIIICTERFPEKASYLNMEPSESKDYQNLNKNQGKKGIGEEAIQRERDRGEGDRERKG